jgi:hypothetical protein
MAWFTHVAARKAMHLAKSTGFKTKAHPRQPDARHHSLGDPPNA